jgi:hypothetical protein
MKLELRRRRDPRRCGAAKDAPAYNAQQYALAVRQCPHAACSPITCPDVTLLALIVLPLLEYDQRQGLPEPHEPRLFVVYASGRSGRNTSCKSNKALRDGPALVCFRSLAQFGSARLIALKSLARRLREARTREVRVVLLRTRKCQYSDDRNLPVAPYTAVYSELVRGWIAMADVVRRGGLFNRLLDKAKQLVADLELKDTWPVWTLIGANVGVSAYMIYHAI